MYLNSFFHQREKLKFKQEVMLMKQRSMFLVLVMISLFAFVSAAQAKGSHSGYGGSHHGWSLKDKFFPQGEVHFSKCR